MLLLNWKMFTAIIMLILLVSKKCDGQVRDALISVAVKSTIVAMLFGTNSDVALQGSQRPRLKIYCS